MKSLVHYSTYRFIQMWTHLLPSLKGMAWGWVLLLLLSSCNKTSVNGPLDGMWQLTTIQTPSSELPVTDSLIYLSIQLQLAQWNDMRHGSIYFSRFLHQGDSLLFYDFVHNSQYSLQNNYNDWMTADEAPILLHPWAIHTLRPAYRVQTLTRSTLILQQADTILHYRKF